VFEDVAAIDKEIVSHGESVGFEVDLDDMEYLVQCRSRDMRIFKNWRASLKMTVGKRRKTKMTPCRLLRS
jgi:lipoate-protein ligase B